MAKNIVIVGGGVAGLAVSARLKAKGHQVTLFEASKTLGGKLHSFSVNGYRFDYGPSLLTMPSLINEIYAECGVEQDVFKFRRLNKLCYYHYNDGTVFIPPADINRFYNEAASFFNIEISKIEQHFLEVERLFKITQPVFLRQSLHKLNSYLKFETLKGILQLPIKHMIMPMQAFNHKRFNNKKFEQFLGRFATYNGSDPYQTPAIMNIIAYLEHFDGAFVADGGIVAVTNSLIELNKRLGTKMTTNAKVDEIIVTQNKATGVRVSGEVFKADVVVSNADVHTTYKKLLPPKWAPKNILQREPSLSGIVFYWGMNKQFPQLGLDNIFFSDDYHTEFSEIFNHNKVPNQPTIYIHISSKEKPDDAPTNGENWFVLINVPADSGQDWDNEAQLLKQRILQRLEPKLGNIAEHIVSETITTPKTIERLTASFRGALYGTSSNHPLSAFLRHPNFSGKIKNLYFAGGSAHPGGGIPLCLNSARITAQLIGK